MKYEELKGVLEGLYDKITFSYPYDGNKFYYLWAKDSGSAIGLLMNGNEIEKVYTWFIDYIAAHDILRCSNSLTRSLNSFSITPHKDIKYWQLGPLFSLLNK